MSRAEELADRIDGLMETGGWRKDAVFITVSAVALAVSLLYGDVGGFDTAWIAVALCGIPISVDAISGLLLRHDIRADVIVFIALCAALYIGDVFTAGEVAAIMQIGGLLEGITAERARSGIGKLIDMSPATARLVDEEGESVINASDVREGDVLRVLPGETVPADGILISGSTSIDQSFMTGESLPADKTAGDEVYGGTVNQYGAFDMRATRDGEDSSIQRMIRLVDSADAGKATTVRAADRWATWIVALIAVIAVSVYLFTEDIVRTVAVLVVFCPCAFILATPTAVVAAIGNASKHGFLVRDGGSLERLSKADRAVFDKTGTLTYGRFEVASVEPADGIDKMYLYSVAASAESMSEHPLGKAVVRDYQSFGGRPKSPEGFSAVPGKGVRAKVSGEDVLAGSEAFLHESGIDVPASQFSWITRIHVSAGGRYLGSIVLSDTLREGSCAAVRELKCMSVEPVLATGDSAIPAMAVADAVGITEVHHSCLPEDKLGLMGEGTCMIGDGINDAPSLKAAGVGISMGGIGSDIAIEASDIVAVSDGIEGIPGLISLSRRMMSRIRFNIAVALCINVVAVSLAAAGLLTPVAGALVHNCGSVFVIVSSALLLGTRWKKDLTANVNSRTDMQSAWSDA